MVEIRNDLLGLLERNGDRSANQVVQVISRDKDCRVQVCLDRRCVYLWLHPGFIFQVIKPECISVIQWAISIIAPTALWLAVYPVGEMAYFLRTDSEKDLAVKYYPIRQTTSCNLPPVSMNNISPIHIPKTSQFEDLKKWVIAQPTPHALVDMTTQIRVACNQAYANATGVPLADCFHDPLNAYRWSAGGLHEVIDLLAKSPDGIIEAEYMAQLKQFPIDLPWKAKFQLIEGIEGRSYRLGHFLSIPSPPSIARPY